jgi:hypothetical protein
MIITLWRRLNDNMRTYFLFFKWKLFSIVNCWKVISIACQPSVEKCSKNVAGSRNLEKGALFYNLQFEIRQTDQMWFTAKVKGTIILESINGLTQTVKFEQNVFENDIIRLLFETHCDFLKHLWIINQTNVYRMIVHDWIDPCLFECVGVVKVFS